LKSPKVWPQIAPSDCAMFVLTSLAFSGADIEFVFVLMTSAYSQYLKDTHVSSIYLAPIGS